MKVIRYILGIFVVVAAVSCEKNVVKYDAAPANGLAEFQLHYFVPLVVNDTNYVYKIELDANVYENGATNTAGVYSPSSMIPTYNAVPGGSTGRFYTTTVGAHNLKMYVSKNFKPLYSQNVTLQEGKQNVFVYDYSKPPIVFNNNAPYPTETTQYTDSSAWVRFYNFMFETGTTPTTLKLQYQYRYVRNVATKDTSGWINLGTPLTFGQSTGWERIPVIKTTELSQGSASVYYRIRLIGTDGSDQGSLQIINSSGKYVDYSDFWTATIGRVYHHVLSGWRADKTSTVAVRQFTAK
jgi:hypothetical protein